MSIKQEIEEKFFQISQDKLLDKITVKDIVTACGISRQTFYYYFQDILEVVEWSFKRKMEILLQQSLLTKEPEEAIKLFVETLSDNQSLIRELYNSNKRDLLERQFISVTRHYLQQLFLYKSEVQGLDHQFVNFGLEFYAIGMCQYVLLHSQEQWDTDRLENWLYQLLSGKFSII